MVKMLTYDAVVFPTKHVKAPAGITTESLKYDTFEESELKAARALLKKELEKSKLTEDQLNEGNWKTTFTVERSAGKWAVNIESQKKEPRKR